MEWWRRAVEQVRSTLWKQKPQPTQLPDQLRVGVNLEHVEVVLRKYRLAADDELARFGQDQRVSALWGRGIMRSIDAHLRWNLRRQSVDFTAEGFHRLATEAALQFARHRWQWQRFRWWRYLDQGFSVLTVITLTWWMIVYPVVKVGASWVMGTPLRAVAGYIIILLGVAFHVMYGIWAWSLSRRINLMELDAFLFVRRAIRDSECGRMVDVTMTRSEEGQQRN